MHNSIKPQELMLNDWVFLNSTNYNRKGYYQINVIHTGEIGLSDRSVVTFPYLEPIPLSKEILEKIFENKGKDDTFSESFNTILDNGKNSVAVSLYPDGFYLNIIRNFKDGQIKKFVKYVHEIQHALRFCGLNEMADNFRI